MTDALASIRPLLASALLVLDFDGTLAPIVARPADVRPARGAIEALVALAPRVRRLAVITGRPAAVAVELGGLARVPGLVVLGHYGLQRWENGVLSTPPPVPGVPAARDALRPVLPAGATVEDKEHSVAVHTRGCADAEAALSELEPAVRALAARHDLEVVGGRAVWELRPPGIDKGSALRALLEQVQPGAVLVAGDDVGDIPMFAVAGASGLPVVRIAVTGAGVDQRVAAAADTAVTGPDALIALFRTL